MVVLEGPPGIREARVAVADRFALDYGKIDYVVHGGHATVLDVNRTPTFGPRLDETARRRTRDVLAPGLASLGDLRNRD